ncbi:MAG: hypothetical protein ACHQT8_04275 [Chlamydiales bacterium]
MSFYYITLPTGDLNLPAQVGILAAVGAVAGGVVSLSASGMFIGGVFTAVTVLTLEFLQTYVQPLHSCARSHPAHCMYVVASMVAGMSAAILSAPIAGYSITIEGGIAISIYAFAAMYIIGQKINQLIVR